MERLQLASAGVTHDNVDLVLLDTAPEAQREGAVEVLRRADWAIVPVKGPEASSVQAVPMLMQWVAEARHARARFPANDVQAAASRDASLDD